MEATARGRTGQRSGSGLGLWPYKAGVESWAGREGALRRPESSEASPRRRRSPRPALELELVRAERLSQLLPGGLDELGAGDDPLHLGLGGVAAHVLLLDYLLEGDVLAHPLDGVLEDLLLALRERRASSSAEKPLPEGSLLAHVLSSSPSPPTTMILPPEPGWTQSGSRSP